MKSHTLALFAVILLIAVPSIGAELVPVVKGRDRTPIIAVWREDSGLGTKDLGPFLITAVWEDGTAIWSKDNVRGGAPYYEARIDSLAVNKVLREFEDDGVFSASYVKKNNFGPDSSFTAVFIADGTKSFISRSWHELAELNPGLVAASHGLTSLRGMTREEFLKNDDKDYFRYRALWERVRAKVASLRPKNGDVRELSLEMKEFQEQDRGDAKKPLASP